MAFHTLERDIFPLRTWFISYVESFDRTELIKLAGASILIYVSLTSVQNGHLYLKAVQRLVRVKICLILPQFTLLSIYRVTLHPLAKYPGNLIDKLTSWRLISLCYGGDRHLRTLEAHKKYGPIIRVGPNTLDIDTVEALVAIHRDRNANVQKGEWYKTTDYSSSDYSVQTLIDKKEHAFRRRLIAPAFTDAALRDQEQYIESSVRSFLDQMTKETDEDGWSTAKDYSEWITYYGFDFISDLSFGKRFNLLGDPKNRHLPDLLKWTSQFIYYAGYLPFAPLVRLVLGTAIMDYVPSKAARDTHHYYQMALDRLLERQASEEKAGATETATRRDIFHYLFHSKDPETGQGLNQNKLHAEAALLIAAGSDGVAVSCAAAVFHLLRNPDMLDRLQQEIRSSFSSLDDVGGTKLNRLPYLQAVLEEAMRLAPSVPSAFPREVLDGGLNIDGVHIPKGITVGVSAYSIHHNEKYYPDSFSFQPDRWLGNKEKVMAARNAFLTFGAGPYNCIGYKVAFLACKLVLARMLYGYDIRPAAHKVTGGGQHGLGKGREREEEYQLTDYLVSYRSGPIVQLKAR